MNEPEWDQWTEVTRAQDARRRAQDQGSQQRQEDEDRAEGDEPTDAEDPSKAKRPERAERARRAPRPEATPATGHERAARPPAHRPDPANSARREDARRRRLKRRAYPLAAIALASFLFGVIKAAGSADEDLAREFAGNWAKQDFAAMYEDLSSTAQQQYSAEAFASAYQDTQTAATAEAIDLGDTQEVSGGAEIDVSVNTRLFGKVGGSIKFPISGDKIDWAPHLTFPGLKPGESLGRRLEVGERAAILARDGTPLAQGKEGTRSSPLGSSAIDISGEVGSPDGALRQELSERGYPTDRPTGISGLERAFNSTLVGVPGGKLLAVEGDLSDPDVPAHTKGRVLATAEMTPGEPVKTTIDPDLQQITVSALGGLSGGAAVLDARNGNVLALAGQAFSNPQPPGSTFKVITTTAALEAKKVKLSDTFPVLSEINAGGRVISNASQELCGGTFVEAFAESCNTVFAPLGVEIGEEKLVQVAERYGWNQDPTLYNAESTKIIDPGGPSIPEDPGDDVDLAASAIGQGQVLATPLSMASVAQTIANGGRRSPTSIVKNPELRPDAKDVTVTSPETARVIKGLMRAVVTQGTGVRGALPNIDVAGKTGTAELGPAPGQPPGIETPVQILDAWFTAFAPADKPKIAVAVLVIDAGGAGGDVAAPIVAQIMAAALE